jgi:N-methylhydantoinase A/oxoprolinase/acetone carboxylase beta subunit
VRVPPLPRALCTPSAGVDSDAWAGSVRPGPHRAGAVPGPASLGGGSHEQAADPHREGHA